MTKHNWDIIRDEYVYGDKNGIFPTLESLAKKHKCSASYLRQKASEDGWARLRLQPKFGEPPKGMSLKDAVLRQVEEQVKVSFSVFFDLIADQIRTELTAHHAIKSSPQTSTLLGCSSVAEWVYMLVDDKHSTIKIGFSSNPMKRIQALQASYHSHLRLLCLIPGDREVEARIHERYAAFRLRGEWFSIDGELKTFVEAFEQKK